MDSKFPKRKRNRLENYDYSTPGAYFITICTHDKKCIFWESEQHATVGEAISLPPGNIILSAYGKITEEAIKAIPEHYSQIELMQYVIMPNHVHMILFITYDNGRLIASPTNISTVVGHMKRHVSKKIGMPIWQTSFYDHIIRNEKDYIKIAEYIHENPNKWQEDRFYMSNT